MTKYILGILFLYLLIGCSENNPTSVEDDILRTFEDIEWENYYEFEASSNYGRASLSFSFDEEYIACGYLTKIYSLSSKKIYNQFGSYIFLSCDFSQKNDILFGSSLYNIADKSIITNYDIPYSVLGGKISNNDSLVGLVTSDIFGGNGSVRIFRIDGEILLSYNTGYFFNFNNESNQFLFSPSPGKISIINCFTGEVLYSKTIGDGFINDAVFSPHDNKIAIASYGTKIKVWSILTDEVIELETATDHYNYSRRVEFTNDEDYLICGKNSRNVSIWNLTTKKVVKNIATHQGDILDLEFSSSGRYIASYGGGTVKIVKAIID